jgi:hypothetical protein
MSHNPYTPPAAIVADAESDNLAQRPRHVTLAVRLCWFGVALGLPAGIYSIFTQPLPEGMPRGVLAGISIFSWLIGFAIVYWIFGAVAKGRNWSRILLAVGLGLNLLVWAVLGKTMMATLAASGTGWTLIVYLLQALIYATAVVLTFTPSAKPWFAPRD